MRPGLVAVLATDVVFAAVCVDALSGPVGAVRCGGVSESVAKAPRAGIGRG
ncbi:hypothetical protein [uncultured Actinomyces sp.]|uniref:hypothetical protein n=1 Tax=uncultured Actinomyces sp. TaxID=249061 RepID=UPI00288979C2|nr:hypothetical protein [uncultured Actinomyces sp.]